MPGIIGVASLSLNTKPVIKRMMSSIKREDWYKEIIHISNIGSFACTHLGLFNHSVIACSKDGKVGLLIDGWIRNMDYDASKQCLELYLKEGKDFVKSLNGCYNIVIWDERISRVYLINDRYGLRPLCYSVLGGNLFFAPQGNAILQGAGQPPQLNNDMVINYLTIGRIFTGTQTFFKDIHVLPPASIYYWENGTLHKERYWDYEYHPVSEISEDFVDETVEIFRSSIIKRLKGKYRFGVTLSGGLDSRIITGTIAENTKNIKAFTFGIENSTESEIACAVANRLNVPWEQIPLDSSDFINMAKEGIRYSEGEDLFVQSYGLSIYPQIRKSVDVLFTGLAMDMIMGGSYINPALINSTLSGEQALLILKKGLDYFDDELLIRLFGSRKMSHRSKELLDDVWQPEKMNTNWADHAERFVMIYRAHRILFKRQSWQRFFLEDACPSFDNRFIDQILRIPTRERMEHRFYRRFMEKLCPHLMDITYQRTMLPPSAPIEFWEQGKKLESDKESLYESIWRATNGEVYIPYKRYATNYSEWLKSDKKWISFTDKLLLSSKIRLTETGIKKETVRSMVEEHRSGKRNHYRRLIHLMTLELFIREFF